MSTIVTPYGWWLAAAQVLRFLALVLAPDAKGVVLQPGGAAPRQGANAESGHDGDQQRPRRADQQQRPQIALVGGDQAQQPQQQRRKRRQEADQRRASQGKCIGHRRHAPQQPEQEVTADGRDHEKDHQRRGDDQRHLPGYRLKIESQRFVHRVPPLIGLACVPVSIHQI